LPTTIEKALGADYNMTIERLIYPKITSVFKKFLKVVTDHAVLCDSIDARKTFCKPLKIGKESEGLAKMVKELILIAQI
jgi:hypothetical protein